METNSDILEAIIITHYALFERIDIVFPSHEIESGDKNQHLIFDVTRMLFALGKENEHNMRQKYSHHGKYDVFQRFRQNTQS